MDKKEPIRLQKFLAQCGIASRRKAEELILQGKVKVNGKPAVLGDNVTDKDKVFVSDDVKAVVGTINLDYRSLYHHFECATRTRSLSAARGS